MVSHTHFFYSHINFLAYIQSLQLVNASDFHKIFRAGYYYSDFFLIPTAKFQSV